MLRNENIYTGYREYEVCRRVARRERIAAGVGGPGVRQIYVVDANGLAPWRIQRHMRTNPEEVGFIENAVAASDRLQALAARIEYETEARSEVTVARKAVGTAGETRIAWEG